MASDGPDWGKGQPSMLLHYAFQALQERIFLYNLDLRLIQSFKKKNL